MRALFLLSAAVVLTAAAPDPPEIPLQTLKDVTKTLSSDDIRRPRARDARRGQDHRLYRRALSRPPA